MPKKYRGTQYSLVKCSKSAPAVIRDIQAIQKHAVAEVERTDVNIEELKRIEEIEGRILPLVDQLRKSMRAEVQQTLASFPEKLWNRTLAIAISLGKEEGGEPEGETASSPSNL